MDLPALFAGCRTEAEFYRVQIAAENVLPPPDIAALAAQAEALPEPARKWLARMRGLLRRSAPGAEPFRRRELGEHVNFYEGSGDAGAPRCLVIGFGGVALRMNVPAAAFLQALPAAACDVLIIGDAARAAFLAGVRGYAPDLPGLAARLAKDLPRFAAYPGGIRCIGTSAGGAAALAFGRLVGARRAVSVDGAHPAALPLRFAQDADRAAFDRAVAGIPFGGTELLIVHGEQSPRDALRGRLLAAGLPGARCVAIRVEAGHGLLGPLLGRSALRRFLAEILLAETPLARMPDVWEA